MEEQHNSFIQIIAGAFGMVAGWFLKYETVIHSVAASFSFWGGVLIVAGGLVNMFTGWSVSGYIKRKFNKRKYKK